MTLSPRHARTPSAMISTTSVIIALLFATPSFDNLTCSELPEGLQTRTQGGGRDLSLLFDSELVRISIDGDSVEVDGLYRFLCTPPESQGTALLYPFPFDSLLGGARMVSLELRTHGQAWRPIAYKEIPKRWVARWFIPPYRADTLEVRAVYRQQLLASYARYIVTTTRDWRRPLSRAVSEIHLPEKARPVEFSYPYEP